jgi:hypothetical protein
MRQRTLCHFVLLCLFLAEMCEHRSMYIPYHAVHYIFHKKLALFFFFFPCCVSRSRHSRRLGNCCCSKGNDVGICIRHRERAGA